MRLMVRVMVPSSLTGVDRNRYWAPKKEKRSPCKRKIIGGVGIHSASDGLGTWGRALSAMTSLNGDIWPREECGR